MRFHSARKETWVTMALKGFHGVRGINSQIPDN